MKGLVHVWQSRFRIMGWSEPTATSAPVQDEIVQTILGMNQKHILFPCPWIFHPPPSYLPHLISCYSISKTQENSWAWVAQSFEKMWDTRLEEGGELNVEGMWGGESKRSASSQMQKLEKKSNLPPFLHFYSSLWFFFLCVFIFLFFMLEKKKMSRRKHLKQKSRNRKA